MKPEAWNETGFASALRAPAAHLPPGLTAWNKHEPNRRFSVYRNNVRGALVEALAVRYPVVMRLVGDEFFRAMARDYALGNLPLSPVLIDYGADFPEFIAGFTPAASLPYLADVARLESAYWQAYHAADEKPADMALLQVLDPGDLANVRLSFIAACAVVTSPHPIVAIWQTNTRDEAVAQVDLSLAEDALVSRPGLNVEVRRLPPGAAAFLTALLASLSLGDAAEAGMQASPEFDLARNIGGLFQAGIVRGFA